jgi:hypothetical protein
MNLHPNLAPLASLLGTWEGDGAGDYPTIDAFRYREQVTFGHVGKPFLSYGQRTWHPDQGTPMHAEAGYLRVVSAPPDPADPAGPVDIELILAHPTGIVEVEEGNLEAGVLRLATTSIGLSRTAKEVVSLRREFRFADGELSYDLWMAYADIPETHHLHASLRRTS